jgi:hypothetical protein
MVVGHKTSKGENNVHDVWVSTAWGERSFAMTGVSVVMPPGARDHCRLLSIE